MTLPHAEMAAPEEAIAEFGDKFAPEPEFKGKPKELYGAQKKPRSAFAAMMKRIDGYVGDIVKTLRDCGELDNTIIFVTSDNGAHCEGGHYPVYWNSNGGFRGIKRDLYKGGIRVPMIVYWKGRLQKSETGHISAFWDIMPTLKDISGASFNTFPVCRFKRRRDVDAVKSSSLGHGNPKLFCESRRKVVKAYHFGT